MGIGGLSRVIADNAPAAMREHQLTAFFGRRVAIDASMCIYQFLVAVRTDGASGSGSAGALTNAAGETTSHLSGMFYRTIRMAEAGIRPLYVFDGAPPTLKGGELAKRLDRRVEAEAQLDAAREAGDLGLVDKFTRRTVKATKQHSEECMKLLRLMGIPVVQAPCEAEAQCAALVRAGHAYAAGSEDMDTLTFAAPVLLRHLTYAEARKMPIVEIEHAGVLSGLGLTREQFVDLCILLGCDYCETIKGVGAVRALALIRAHGSIEGILEAIASATEGSAESRFVVPQDWPYAEARRLFLEPEVLAADDPQIAPAVLKGGAADVDGVIAFMCGQGGFSEERVRSGLARLAKTRAGAMQGRLDTFFAVKRADSPAASSKASKNKASSNKASNKIGAKKPKKA